MCACVWEGGEFICFLLFFLFAQAYDQHLNMILGEVEETVTTVELDEETFEEIYKVSNRAAYMV